jgi:hypothetical protein
VPIRINWHEKLQVPQGRLSNPTQMNPENRSILPKLAFTSFSSRYQKPELTEGFQDITEVPFKVRFTAFPCIYSAEAIPNSSRVARPNEKSGLNIGFEAYMMEHFIRQMHQSLCTLQQPSHASDIIRKLTFTPNLSYVNCNSSSGLLGI